MKLPHSPISVCHLLNSLSRARARALWLSCFLPFLPAALFVRVCVWVSEIALKAASGWISGLSQGSQAFGDCNSMQNTSIYAQFQQQQGIVFPLMLASPFLIPQMNHEWIMNSSTK